MLYDEQIAALRRIFNKMGDKAAKLLNYMRVAEGPVSRLKMGELLFPGKNPINVDNLLAVTIRPTLFRIGIIVCNEPGQGWYLLPADKDKLTEMMAAPSEYVVPVESQDGERSMRLAIYVPQKDVGYLTTCARIRNVSVSTLVRRLLTAIADDKMVEAILDDMDDKRARDKGDHHYKQPANG